MGVTMRKIVDILSPALKKDDYFIKKQDDEQYTVHAQNIGAYNHIKTTFLQNNCRYYTYTPKNLKNKNLILKGVSEEYMTAEVEAELKEMNIERVKIVKISELTFNKNKPGPLKILVQITNDSDAKNLTRIRYILYSGVKWEPLRKKSLYQCKNCQRVGHTSAKCGLGYRCVKCNSPHKPGECQLRKDSTDKSKVYCVNCKKFGHPVSYQGCEFLKYHSAIKNEVRKINAQKVATKINRISSRTTPSPLRDPSLSYAQAMGGRIPPTSAPPRQPPPYDANASPNDIISFLNNFKNHLIQHIDMKIKVLEDIVTENTTRINTLYEMYENDENGGY